VSSLTETLQTIYRAYESGDVIRAEIDMRTALQTWPDQADVLRLGALTALAINQVVTADQRLAKAAQLTPITAEMANTRGNILKAAADWSAAEAAYDEAERLDPTYTPVKGNRIDLFVQSGQPRRVLNLLKSDHDYGEMGEFARSQALTNLGRYEEALDVISAIDANRYTEQFCLQRIKCFAALGRLDEMQAAFEAVDFNSNFAKDALGVAVNAFEMRGMRSEALDVIAHASADTTVAPTVLTRGARLLRRAGRTGMAEAVLKTALERYGDDADVIAEQANAALISNKSEESYSLYRQALRLRPGDFSVLMGQAQAALMAGRYSDAQKAIQGAMAQAPNNQFLLALAATLMRENKQEYRALYNYDNFVRVYDLVPPQGYDDMATFNAALKARLDNLHVYIGTPVNQSLRGGTQTEVNLALVEDPVIESFFQAVDAPIKDYMAHLGQDDQHPLRRRNRNKYRINGAWSVRLSENGHHVNHVHPMGWLSSAYYVDVPSSIDEQTHQGWIKFGEPALDVDQPAEHFVQPKPGRLVLFPSYMWHGTVPFTGDATRLTLPFDVVPA